MAKVLVTGATGFIGKRLILSLLNQGHTVYALCRIKGTKAFMEDNPLLHYIWGDLQNPETLKGFPADLDVAYYLVHSMSEIVNDLVEAEKLVVGNFLNRIKETTVKQLIYLGGIINDESHLSPHLKARLFVENELNKSNIPLTVLRASIIIGAGSASFEIIRDLCEKLPIMVAPRWVNTACQPIAVSDVLFYLIEVLLNKQCFAQVYDIGGPQVLTFKEMMLDYSKFRELKTKIIEVPFLTPVLSSYWLLFITSVKYSLCYYLVESMRSSTIVKLGNIQQIIPHICLSYEKGLELAFQHISQNEVVSTWMDSWEMHGMDPNIADYVEVPQEGCLKDVRKVEVKGDVEACSARIWSIGGSAGYYTLAWAWESRGFIDRMMGGIGLNRGRRHPTQILVGDSIDFWRVLLADKEHNHLILFSEMKVPGEAWLEFEIQKVEGQDILIQTATFRPQGIWGRLYWYALYPIHFFLFRRMARAIAGAS